MRRVFRPVVAEKLDPLRVGSCLPKSPEYRFAQHLGQILGGDPRGEAPVQDPTGQDDRTSRDPRQPSYIPSGNLRPLSSKAFFNTSTSKAFRPSARSNSSTRFCKPST